VINNVIKFSIRLKVNYVSTVLSIKS